jgi:hypothetical protein
MKDTAALVHCMRCTHDCDAAVSCKFHRIRCWLLVAQENDQANINEFGGAYDLGVGQARQEDYSAVALAGMVHDREQLAHHVAGAYRVVAGFRLSTTIVQRFGGKSFLELAFGHHIIHVILRGDSGPDLAGGIKARRPPGLD